MNEWNLWERLPYLFKGLLYSGIGVSCVTLGILNLLKWFVRNA